MKNITVSVVGLGYVGLPVAVAFGRKRRTIGFDINKTRPLYTSAIADLKKANPNSSRPGATDKANVSWGTRPMRRKTVGQALPSPHTFTKIQPLDTVAAVYGLVLTGGVHKAVGDAVLSAV